MGLTVQELAKKYGGTYSSTPTLSGKSLVSSSAQSLVEKYGGFATPAPEIPKPDMFAGTKQVFSDLIADPLTLNANPKKAISDAWEVIKGSVITEAQNIKNIFTPVKKEEAFTSGESAKFASQNLKVLSGGANVLLSPISALFAGAEQIPVLGSVAKLVSLPFSAVGEFGAGLGGGVIDKLPIDQKTKDQLKPGVEEIFALAGQLMLGKGMDSVKRAKLETKFGKQDAVTIEKEATKLAQQKTLELNPELKTPTMADSLVEKYGGTTETAPKTSEFSPKQPQGEVLPAEMEKVSPLIQEAKKYKSAEEFVKAQPTTYHTTKLENVKNINEKGFSGEIGDMSKASGGTMEKGVFLYPEKSSADVFGKNFKNPSVIETKINGKVYDANTQTKYGWEDDLQTQEIAKDKNIISQLKKDGYVGVKSTELGTDAIFVFEPNAVKTKSQLTDIWNKAQEKVQLQQPQISGVAKQIEAKAIEQGLTDKGFTELADYDASTIKKQGEIGSQYTPEQLREIAKTGNLPEGMKPATPLSILEDFAKKNKDLELMRELAKSPLITRISESASEVSLSRMRDKGGVVENIRQVFEARKKEAGQNLSLEENRIKEASKKVKPTKDAWLEFVDSIKC